MVPGYHRPAVVKVNLGQLEEILRMKCSTLNQIKDDAVVKANGYGHGAVEVAKVAEEEGVAGFCVAILDEALDCAVLILLSLFWFWE